MTRMIRLLLILFLTAVVAAARADVLENAFVRVDVDPRQGGAVTALSYRKAVTLAYIAERGAGVAGTGRLFTGLLQVGEVQHDLAAVAMKTNVRHGAGGETVLTMTAPLPSVALGLSLTRTLRMGRDESGFRLTETLRNDRPGARPVTLRVGTRSRQQPEPWRLALRCWFGDAQRGQWHFTPYNAGEKVPFAAQSPRLFWRVIGQYGVGFLYRVQAPRAPVDLLHVLPKETGNPAEFQWISRPLTLAAGETLSFESDILVDEGGREGNDFPSLAAANGLIVTADMRAAGRASEVMPAAAAVVSAVPRRVKLVVSQWFAEAGGSADRKVLRETALTLAPGKAQRWSFDVVPERKGLCYLGVAVQDEAGKELAATRARSVIDGQAGADELGQVWERYTSRLPEVVRQGTWEEIGAQLAKSGTLGPLKARDAPDGQAAERLAFYEQQFPFYARLLKGAAGALQVTPERLAHLDLGQPASQIACMGVFLNGPDGPINAYSKERGGSSLSGLGYAKIIPDAGYSYHMYTLGNWSFGYGVNSEGLCTSGATINCDAETEQQGAKFTDEWRKAGKRIAPLGVHMMLATCKNVEEAIAFITNPRAPFDFTGNMLLVDRAGSAAILESVGVFHQILRPRGETVFASGNYSHERSDGLFKSGDNWGWAANTMLRERALAEILTPSKGMVSLPDVFRIMESHALPGNMCQHVFENPAQLYSSCSCIAVAKTGDLYISNGPPCQVQYVRYTLNDGK